MECGREVVVLGIGMHPWGMFPDRDFTELGAYAIREALKDASMTWKDIQFMGCGVDQWRGTSGLWASMYESAGLSREMMSRLLQVNLAVTCPPKTVPDIIS